MKKLDVTGRLLCQNCLSCEISCSEAFYKSYGVNTSCIEIDVKKDNSINVKAYNQCGLCAKKCPGYLECIKAFPKGIIAKADHKSTPSKCIACGICVKVCPMYILAVREG